MATHHMDAPTEPGVSHYGLPSFLQGFLDSQLGTMLAIFLHTSGVFLFVGGLGYAALHIFPTNQRFTQRHLRLTRWMVWGGLAFNVIGGVMRLGQSDHPTLASLNEDPWVQILLTKHLLWIVLLGVTAYLLHRVMPRLAMENAANANGAIARAARKATLQSIGLVLLIAAAGAAAVTIGPGSHGMDTATDTNAPTTGLVAVNRTLDQPFSGTITGLPNSGTSQEFSLEVPRNATRLEVTLTWSGATAQLQLSVVDPNGRVVPATGTTGKASLGIEAPMAGAWRVIVSSQQAVQEPYSGTIHIAYVAHVMPGETTHVH